MQIVAVFYLLAIVLDLAHSLWNLCTGSLIMCWNFRQQIVAPLYQLLKYYQGEKLRLSSTDLVISEPPEEEVKPLISLDYIQQLILMNLEKLANTILSDTNPEHAVSEFPLF